MTFILVDHLTLTIVFKSQASKRMLLCCWLRFFFKTIPQAYRRRRQTILKCTTLLTIIKNSCHLPYTYMSTLYPFLFIRTDLHLLENRHDIIAQLQEVGHLGLCELVHFNVMHDVCTHPLWRFHHFTENHARCMTQNHVMKDLAGALSIPTTVECHRPLPPARRR